MFIVTDVIGKRTKRMNSDIQIIHVLSSDDPSDRCPGGCSGDEFTDMVFVTVIALGVAKIVTTVLVVVITCVLITAKESVRNTC